MTPPGSSRRQELADGLAAVETRIDAACQASGRVRSDLTLVVITKTFPASDVRLLAGLGVRDVGESRDQEAGPKAGDCVDLGLSWHFVGRLQRNKAKSVAEYASVVHSVDRASLVSALGSGAQRAGRVVEALVQVSLDGDPDRGGVPVDGVAALADRVAGQQGLLLRGLMAVAPLGQPPERAFALLAELSGSLREAHPDAFWVSAGMSGDLEAAVAAGATHLRVGSAILGSRPLLG
jgi:pyridoxal phosphate enzyme (YggS family)